MSQPVEVPAVVSRQLSNGDLEVSCKKCKVELFIVPNKRALLGRASDILKHECAPSSLKDSQP
jgi:hypothetical protein